MEDEKLPLDLRSTFTQLMSHLHVVAHRESPLVIVSYAHLWTKIATDVSVDRQVAFCVTSFTRLSRAAAIRCRRVGALKQTSKLLSFSSLMCEITSTRALQRVTFCTILVR